MASVSLTGIWIGLVSDPRNQLHFTKVDIHPDVEVPGEFRIYANGVVRLMKGSGKLQRIEAELRGVTRAERETLEAWQGQLQIYRDSRGRLLYGSFLELGGPDKRGSDGLADLTFRFTKLTHSIEV